MSVDGILGGGVIQRALPPGWRHRPRLTVRTDAGALLGESQSFAREDGLFVIAAREDHDGEEVPHVSCSFPDRLPSWADLKAVKALFLGDCFAVQMLPPEREYVNLHEYVLHLWARSDGSDPTKAREAQP